jgi:hypothetical protein
VAKAYLKQHELNNKHLRLIQSEDRRMSNMSNKDFIKIFNLSTDTSSMEIRVYKIEIHNQLKPYYLKASWNTGVNAVSEIIEGGKQNIINTIETIHSIIGSSGSLGYDYVPNTVTLRGIYELQ